MGPLGPGPRSVRSRETLALLTVVWLLDVSQQHPWRREWLGLPLAVLNVLVKHHYDWLLAAVTAAVLMHPPSWEPFRRALRLWRGNYRVVLLASWAAITIVVPSVMRTKLPWYLNPFYPTFALAVAWVLHYGLSGGGRSPRHRTQLAAVIAW